MEIVARATVIYFFLWVVTRGVGKRELSELTAFDVVLMVTLGDLVQQGVTQDDMSLTGAMLAVATFAFWILVLSYAGWRVTAARPVLEGVPVVVVNAGRPVDEALRVERLTLDEVKEEARGQGIADLRDVKLGVLEPGGTFSFIKYDGDQSKGPEKHRAE